MHELTTDLCTFLNIAMQLWFFQCRQTQAIVARHWSLPWHLPDENAHKTPLLGTAIKKNPTTLSLVQVINLLIGIEWLKAVIHLRANWLICRKYIWDVEYDRLSTQAVCLRAIDVMGMQLTALIKCEPHGSEWPRG